MLITRHLRTTFALLIFAFSVSAQASLPQASSVPGGVTVIPLEKATGNAKPQAWFENNPVLVAQDKDEWYAIVGLSLETEPGSYTLSYRINGATRKLSFEVESKQYPEQHITLKDNGKVELSKKHLERALREIKLIKSYKQHWTEEPGNDLSFILPADGTLSSNFGLRRFFNEKPRSPHAGIDLAVAQGTPVKAPAAGTILAADDFFFNGKTVFIDHGNGLITMYCHLSEFKVKPGDTVSKGQEIALSGMTGRATGPHLHWSVILNGEMVNPELFVR